MSEENEAVRIIRGLMRGGCLSVNLPERTCRHCHTKIGGSHEGTHRPDCPFVAGLEFLHRCERRRAG